MNDIANIHLCATYKLPSHFSIILVGVKSNNITRRYDRHNASWWLLLKLLLHRLRYTL